MSGILVVMEAREPAISRISREALAAGQLLAGTGLPMEAAASATDSSC